MLSHHELATLLRLNNDENRRYALDLDLLALHRHQLVELDGCANDAVQVTLTDGGRELVQRLRLRSASSPSRLEARAATINAGPQIP